MFSTDETAMDVMFPMLSINNIDILHRQMIYTILCNGNFKYSLEIGSWDGGSAPAFIEAINKCRLISADFCDINFQPRFFEVLKTCVRSEKIICYNCKSIDIKYDKYDFVFVDGDHSLENVTAETKLLLSCKVETIMAHDTNIMPGPAHLMSELLRNGYYVLHDCKKRENSHTDRGLMFATTNYDIFSKVQLLFFFCDMI